MTDLIAKLKALSEPSREVDAEIACLMVPLAVAVAENAPPGCCEKAGFGLLVSQRYTSDLNVVIALVLEKFPDAYIVLDNELYLEEQRPMWTAGVYGKSARRPLPAVALLLALLEAMEGEDG